MREGFYLSDPLYEEALRLAEEADRGPAEED